MLEAHGLVENNFERLGTHCRGDLFSAEHDIIREPTVGANAVQRDMKHCVGPRGPGQRMSIAIYLRDVQRLGCRFDGWTKREENPVVKFSDKIGFLLRACAIRIEWKMRHLNYGLHRPPPCFDKEEHTRIDIIVKNKT